MVSPVAVEAGCKLNEFVQAISAGDDLDQRFSNKNARVLSILSLSTVPVFSQ